MSGTEKIAARMSQTGLCSGLGESVSQSDRATVSMTAAIKSKSTAHSTAITSQKATIRTTSPFAALSHGYFVIQS
jgi:hypothetical protein